MGLEPNDAQKSEGSCGGQHKKATAFSRSFHIGEIMWLYSAGHGLTAF
jgi:hypothetical protein